MDDSTVHGSILRRIPVKECRLSDFQEIEVAENGRRIALLHDAATGASRVLSLDFTVGFHLYRATTRWIDAMPALAGFHDHGPFSSLRKNGWMSAKAIAGRPVYVEGYRTVKLIEKQGKI